MSDSAASNELNVLFSMKVVAVAIAYISSELQ